MRTKPPRAGMGRPKGSVNKVTGAVKDMVLQALDGVGGIEYLKQQAMENPTAFLTLVGKVIPTQVNLADAEGGKLTPYTVNVGIPDAKPDSAQEAGPGLPN